MSAIPISPSLFDRPNPPIKPRKIQPLRAFRAFRRLIEDNQDTRQVFEIMAALAGKSTPRGYNRLLGTVEGGRQAYLAEELSDRLQDRDWLRTLPSGSVGAAYLAFCEERDLSAYGLAEESRHVEDVDFDAAHPVAWYARRLRDVHDIWHILTGYRPDSLGEACVVAFSLPQSGSLGFGFIAAGVAVEYMKRRTGHPCAGAVFQAYRHGRRAAWLPAIDYVALLAEPLETARARLGIRTPDIYLAIPREVCDALAEPKAA